MQNMIPIIVNTDITKELVIVVLIALLTYKLIDLLANNPLNAFKMTQIFKAIQMSHIQSKLKCIFGAVDLICQIRSTSIPDYDKCYILHRFRNMCHFIKFSSTYAHYVY